VSLLLPAGFLISEISASHAILNIPDDPNLAIASGRKLCSELHQPLRDRFGALLIRSSFQSH
ncbi:MAG: hypothetical protein VYB45_10660, partial [Pseudomonadota bacterium]|nr:hypothetical protein [Pseudomonadota bacterium]